MMPPLMVWMAPWLEEAEDSMLGAFARGLRKDCDAVAASPAEPWSNGPTEGQINRLKIPKRQMHGGGYRYADGEDDCDAIGKALHKKSSHSQNCSPIDACRP
ncbi:transposase [Mangrovicoccus sp. HB161399]|uniref:transposase n=1 Tax=Mangrovicoccus sp. HB161399 TaxID=2720392 RepID=UPI0015529E89|nr:transposase [Mangrovicoccus sp. HB161399]